MLTLISLTIGLRRDHTGSGGYITLTSLTIWLRWEEAGSGGSGFAGRGETTFTDGSGAGITGWVETGCSGSKLVAVDPTWLVGVKMASVGSSW